MPGFKSRWMMLNLCRYWIPSNIDLIINDISESVNFYFWSNRSLISCLRVPPAIYSMIKYKLVYVSLNELNFTMFLCSIEDNISAYFLKLCNLCRVKSCLWNICIFVFLLLLQIISKIMSLCSSTQWRRTLCPVHPSLSYRFHFQY